MADSTELTAPVFVLGSHKSGSTLLVSLLDGHPEIDFVVPMELHYFQFSNHWVYYPLRAAAPVPDQTPDEALVAAAIPTLIRQREKHFNRFGGALGPINVDTQRVSSSISVPTDSDRERFARYVHAVHEALYRKPLRPGARIVEKSVENAAFAPFLRTMFTDCRFVHIVRNPYASVVAVRKSKPGLRVDMLGNVVESIADGFRALVNNRRHLHGYHVLRYEDLIQDPATAMRGVAEAAGISYADSLVSPTANGRVWQGNSSSGREMTGISGARVDAWQDEITQAEVRAVNRVLRPALAMFGYHSISDDDDIQRKLWYSPPSTATRVRRRVGRMLRHLLRR
jgi:hypothetical protein